MVDTAIDAMAAFLRSGDNANGHGVFAASTASTELVASTRHRLARLLGADADGFVFGANMTTLTFAFTRALVRTLGPDDEVVGTCLDHDANVTPWALTCRDAGATSPRTVRHDHRPPRPGRGHRPDRAPHPLDRHHRRVERARHDARVAAVVTAAHERGVRVFVDGVHLVPHAAVDLDRLGCDVFVTSPYKWYGPHAGIMWISPSLRDTIEPYKVRPAPDRAPERWETGTVSFENIAAIDAAAEFLLDAGMDTIASHESRCFAGLLDGLLANPAVTVLGPRDRVDRTPTVSFTVAGHHPDAVAQALAAQRVAVWSGNYYAVETMSALGLSETGAIRAGLSAYTDADDVARLLDALQTISG